ncbi:hypothetical protein AB3S75_042784 [Citrus x aurantiifolia]
MTAQQVYSICNKFNFENRFAVDRTGMGGGLALFWSSGVNVSIKSFSSHHIDAVVQNPGGKSGDVPKFTAIQKLVRNSTRGVY